MFTKLIVKYAQNVCVN